MSIKSVNVYGNIVLRGAAAVLLCLLMMIVAGTVLTPTASAQQSVLATGFCYVGPYSPNNNFYDSSMVSLDDCFYKAQQYASSSTDGYGYGEWDNPFSNSEIFFRVNERGLVQRKAGGWWRYHKWIGASSGQGSQQSTFVRGYCQAGSYYLYDYSYITLRECYRKVQRRASSSTNGFGYGEWDNPFSGSKMRFAVSEDGVVYRLSGGWWYYQDRI